MKRDFAGRQSVGCDKRSAGTPIVYALWCAGAALVTPYGASHAATMTIDFEELPLAAGDYYNGADQAGEFISRHVRFNNLYTPIGADCCWNGWAYSQTADSTTPGALNQYSAFPGAGALQSPRYGVAFSGHDAGGGIIPSITLPVAVEPVSAQFANTTYAALSMRHGDGFAKKFGGASGNDLDWFRLTIEGRDAANSLVGAVEFYLADFRFENAEDDFIRDQWATVDLTPLAGLGVESLAVRLHSTDFGDFGMNTPAYVALDDLLLQITAEPGDFNLNGMIDETDLGIWYEHFGALGTADAASGDANDDGNATGRDLLAWQRGVHLASGTTASVPEPGTLALVVGAGVLPLWRWFRHFPASPLPRACMSEQATRHRAARDPQPPLLIHSFPGSESKA